MENTMVHPETGKILYRDIRPIEYRYKEQRITVNQPGWYPPDKDDDDGVFSQDDMDVSDIALAIMKERHQKFLEKQNMEFGQVSFA